MPFVAAAITAISGAVAGSALGAFLTETIFGRLLLSVAISAVRASLAGKPKVRTPGIRTQKTQSGGVTPASFILGTYASEGQLTCPPMSHGTVGGTPNAYLTFVIELGDIPGQTLEGLILEGERAEFGNEAHEDYGTPILGRFTDYAWVRYYDGTQTVADPMLLDKYADYPDRPWTADMIGTGICYAVLTFRFKREVFSSFPSVRFELGGIPLYDPRKDTSVGGAGPHRWADKATWEASANVAVQAYNIHRGIDLDGGEIWGGNATAADLPLAVWWAAMNTADEAVTLADETSEPRFRTSYEVFVDDEPAAVLEEMMAATGGEMVESGGVWKIRLGGPGLPVFFMTDDDILITESEQFKPFAENDDPINAIQAVYPDPATLWQPREAPKRTYVAFQTEDGGQQRVADLNLSACPYPQQVQRIMDAYVRDDRRLRTHDLTLPADASVVEPLDTIAWTSERNGYDGKIFDVGSDVNPLMTGLPRLNMREVDPADFDWNVVLETQVLDVPVTITQPQPQSVAGFHVEAFAVVDAGPTNRRPALNLTWLGDGQDDVSGLMWEVRLKDTSTVALRGNVTDITAGELLLAAGILPDTDYEARAQWDVNRPTSWTAWVAATTPDIRPGRSDLGDDVNTALDEAKAAADEAGINAIEALEDAGDLQSDHDALTEGFVGSLSDAFQQQTDANAQLDTVLQGRIASVRTSLISNARHANGGFELGEVGETGVPPGWLGRAFNATAFDNLEIFGDDMSDPDANFASARAFGQTAFTAGRWWAIGKRFLGGGAQTWRVSYAVRTSGNPGNSASIADDHFVGEEDVLLEFVFIDAEGSEISRAVSNGAAHLIYTANGNTIDNATWYRVAYDQQAPAGTAYLEVWFIAVDANNSVVTDLADYNTWASGNAAILIDNTTVENLDGFTVEADQTNAAIYENFYTSAQANAAIAAAVTALEASIGTDLGFIAGSIDNIEGLQLNPQTAFGTLLNQLQVSAGGVSATITQHASAVADLSGFASAYAGVTVETASGGIAGFRATSFANPNGTGGALLELLGDVIAPGTLATNRLTVGLGQNLLSNTDFSGGIDGWRRLSNAGGSGDETELSLRNAGENFAGTAYPVLQIRQTGASGDGNYRIIQVSEIQEDTTIDGVPVTEGDWIEASFKASAHRCDFEFRFRFLDANGSFLSFGPRTEVIDGPTGSSDNPNLWAQYWTKDVVPAGAAYAGCQIIKKGTKENDNSILYLHQPQIAKSHENAQHPAPFSPGGTTLIDGGKLRTNSVTARSIAAGSIKTEHLDVENLTVTGDMIDNDATSRRFFTANFTQTVVQGSYNAVSDVMECAFAPYVPIDPAVPTSGVTNPMSAIVNGLFKPLTAADGRLYFKMQGRQVPSGGWTDLDVMGIRYFYASDVNRDIEFNLLWADDAVGVPANTFDEFRVVAQQLDAGSGDVTLTFVNTRLEQINGYS
ncbi:hypothetical protein ASD8599_01721 [Ascidiaceihabitans donghaensis]|uniref:Tip attachment protein J domain-containing protein n=1 Tax=Ascidiaceihabitans donghaensis TaxID=1510460 RepID=A0A2R8BD29_9RHOB|nr:phage tail protein [Ascidiaceihabitans donghaensis]SPH20980.1 hypothetical protein ASD8599_01721 [Ascidiaceihabitans donghaensis]